MTNNKGAPRGAWSQPSPRAEMVAAIKALDQTARLQRFATPHGETGHIDDEVVVTLLLDAWTSGSDREAETYSSELLRRVTLHVRAHVRKNPGWQRLGGGAGTAIEDFCQETVVAILRDQTVPCHAEIAFGNFVYRRCLDQAGKLYAKKHSAGQSLNEEDDQVDADADTPTLDSVDLSATHKSPEQLLIEVEELLADKETVEEIRRIVQTDLPERAKLAFTYRFFGSMKIESKKPDEVTVTKLLGVTEKTATKYINEAITIIKQRLTQ